MSDLLREVDDAIRAEKMQQFWDEHKIAIIAGIAALILGTALFSGWNSYQTKKNSAGTARITAALESAKPAEALAAAAQANSGDTKMIALLNAAALSLKNADKQKALEYYTQASAMKSSPADLRDLATLQKVNLLLDVKPDPQADTLLKDLASIKNDSPFYGEALFMNAFITGELNKDFTAAGTALKTLAARDDIPPSLQQRAQALQSVYDLKKAEPK